MDNIHLGGAERIEIHPFDPDPLETFTDQECLKAASVCNLRILACRSRFR